MAKGSGKTTFKDTVAAYERLRREIAGGTYAPVYLLMGEEGYFIDRIADLLAGSVLTEAERDFNQIVVYGKDTDEGTIINYARQMPMMGRYEVIIVKEAQSLRKPEQLSLYTAAPSPSTILVICYKGKSLDKRTQLYKHIAQKGEVLESVRPRDYEITAWLGDFVKSKGCGIDPKALGMLTDHLGTDIARISNELNKLLTYLPEGTKQITAQHIEDNIGISKDFNNFELTKAVSEKNMARAMLIADHFRRNPKDNPLHPFPAHLHRQLQTMGGPSQEHPSPLGRRTERPTEAPQPLFPQRIQTGRHALSQPQGIPHSRTVARI